MPFINGRYHLNPTMGQALEAARDAEAAMLALQQRAARNSEDDASESSAPSSAEDAPIHRIEIDATEVVPSATGRATRGYVARIHRTSATPAWSSCSTDAPQSPSPAPDTQVFTDHRDLLSFLQNALAQK